MFTKRIRNRTLARLGIFDKKVISAPTFVPYYGTMWSAVYTSVSIDISTFYIIYREKKKRNIRTHRGHDLRDGGV